MVSFRLRLLLVGLAAALLAGCQQDEIRTYTVPKAEMTRLLGAILPHDDSTWFFKVSGPATAVGTHEEEFTAFLRSLHFAEVDGKLAWTLPNGWELDKRDRPNRYATIRVGTTDALELTITKLGREGQAANVLANVNRWRNQLTLAPVTQEELPKETKVLNAEAGAITLVDLTGTGSGKTGMGAPMVADRVPPAAAAAKGVKSDLGYQAPAGWKKTAGNGISKVTFQVGEGDKLAVVTVTPLPGAAGGLEPNVNRWRGQVGLQPLTAEDVNKIVKEIPVNGKTGQYADLAGTTRRILAVLVARDDTTWFVKMDGTVDLVGKQKANFEAFVRSLRFDGGPGGNDG
jgi:hypothetical protein